jgi:hypothetical protein
MPGRRDAVEQMTFELVDAPRMRTAQVATR